MTTEKHQYCLILAGGIGSRLWPVSRRQKPKQFLDLFGTGRSLLQQTYDRFAQFFPSSQIFISTQADYLSLVREQLPHLDDVHILVEPLQRGTLAAVAWGTVCIQRISPQATILVSPADQLILREQQFQEDILHGMRFVHQCGGIVVMGVSPTRAETDYGYIQVSDTPVDEDIYRVKSFTEKPNAEFARIFVEDGSFLWNAGLFAFDADVMLESIYRLVPEYQMEIPKMLANAETGDPRLLPECFNVLPNMSIDLGVLERSQDVFVHHCQFGWADLGAWSTLLIGSDQTGNVLVDTQAILHECSNNIVRLPHGRMAVIEGLTDYVVAEEGDVLLICPKDRTSVRRARTEAILRQNLD